MFKIISNICRVILDENFTALCFYIIPNVNAILKHFQTKRLRNFKSDRVYKPIYNRLWSIPFALCLQIRSTTIRDLARSVCLHGKGRLVMLLQIIGRLSGDDLLIVFIVDHPLIWQSCNGTHRKQIHNLRVPHFKDFRIGQGKKVYE